MVVTKRRRRLRALLPLNTLLMELCGRSTLHTPQMLAPLEHIYKYVQVYATSFPFARAAMGHNPLFRNTRNTERRPANPGAVCIIRFHVLALRNQ